MPIVDPDDSAAVVEQPNTVRIAAPEYRGVVVDTRYQPAKALLTNVEGSSWTVNYYSQVLDDDSAIVGQSVGRNAIYQQYKLIQRFEFKVTTPLTANQEDDTKAFTYTGAANVYPHVIPNIGDMFIADIGDGREGIFRITTSERKSVFKDTVHSVEYQMVDYATPMRLTDLNEKVVQSLTFVKDFLLHGQNPLVVEEDYNNLLSLQGWYQDLITKYFKWFTSKEFQTLLVPGQPTPTYDSFATKAIVSFFDTREAPELRQLRQLNVSGDDAMESTSIWDALVKRDRRLLRHGHKQAGLVLARSFERNPMLEGVYWSGVQYVVYPKDPERSVDFEYRARPKNVLDEALQPVATQIRSLQDLVAENTLFHGLPYSEAPVIHDVLDDDYYVFSQLFYEVAATGQSKLELCVQDYLDGKALDRRVLLALCQTCHGWGGLERFYYIPIVLILVRAAIRGI